MNLQCGINFTRATLLDAIFNYTIIRCILQQFGNVPNAFHQVASEAVTYWYMFGVTPYVPTYSQSLVVLTTIRLLSLLVPSVTFTIFRLHLKDLRLWDLLFLDQEICGMYIS